MALQDLHKGNTRLIVQGPSGQELISWDDWQKLPDAPAPPKPVPTPAPVPTPTPKPPATTKVAVGEAIPPQTVVIGEPYEFKVPANAFTGTVTSMDFGDLPGLWADGGGRRIHGKADRLGKFNINVFAFGPDKSSARSSFALTVLSKTAPVPPTPPAPPKPIEPKEIKYVASYKGTPLKP